MAANLYKPRPTSSMLRAPGSDASNPPPNTRSLQPGSVVMGRYTIQKIIGRGGMATVYLAKNQETERLVALKILDPEISSDPSYVERFRREARAAGRIRSDHVVAIYDLGADEYGTLVLVMEYLEGQTVQQALRNGRLPLQRAAILGRQLCEGLAAAHESGVIHRDLKPANLIIERLTGGAEKLKILDFGISKLAEASSQELTRAGQTLGTLAYMAPEQIRGAVKGNDPRIDLYSAGVSLFLMFTAKRPIDADDTVQLLQAVLEKPPLTLAQAAGTEFPPAFEAFVAKCLQKDPTRRYQSALEMRDGLLQAAHDSGIDAIAHFSSPNAQHAPPPARQSAPPAYATPPSGVSSTIMEPAPTFTPPSGVIVSNIEPSGPAPSLNLPSFDDDEEEGKTEVRAPNMQQSGPSMPLPLAGRRPTPPVGMPVAAPTAPAPRSPTMSGPVAQSPGQPTIPPQRSGTLLGMPDAPPPPMLGGSAQGPLGESPPTQAVDVFGGPPPASPAAPQFGAAPAGFTANNALTMPPPTGGFAEEPPPAKRSSMKFVLLAACAASALILSVAGYVAVSGRRAATASPQAAIRATAPAHVAARTAPTPAAPAAAAPAPVAQPLAPAPVAQPLAPTAPAEAAPQAQVLAAPEAPAQPPAEAAPAAPAENPAQVANDDERPHRRGRRQPAAAPAPAPTRTAAAPRPARPAAAPAAPAAPRPARPARPRRGPIVEIPF
ncbi:MAG: protein kinase [Polyangiales bacterium]